MAQYFGTMQGNKAEITRCGSKKSGFRTVAASYTGAVEVNIWYNDDFYVFNSYFIVNPKI